MILPLTQTTFIGLLAVVASVGVTTIGAITWLMVRWQASTIVDHVAELALREYPAERRAEIVAATADSLTPPC